MNRYDIARSYDWNYDHVPDPPVVETPPFPGTWDFCGLPVNSPLGIPAGPLLNSGWIRYYAALGFDVLTYKTVRSRRRPSYDPPNLLPVSANVLSGEGTSVEAAADGAGSATWAISFGMPSKDPAVWRADVERARLALRRGQVLTVSVVASPESDWTLGRIAQDFADCAGWAVESGAQAVEANLSCPNVCSGEADLYLNAEAAGEIAAAVRERAGKVPLILKIGLFQDRGQAEALVGAVHPWVDALSTANSITATVRGRSGEPLFGGLRRGIGGAAITARCLEELKMLADIIRRAGAPLRLIGVGGVMTAADVRDRIAAGAHHVQLATAPMLDPLAGIRIRREWDGANPPAGFK